MAIICGGLLRLAGWKGKIGSFTGTADSKYLQRNESKILNGIQLEMRARGVYLGADTVRFLVQLLSFFHI